MRTIFVMFVACLATAAFAADPTTLVIPKITKPLVEPVENDPLQADYDKMWTEYEGAVQKATVAIKEALDNQISKATDSGELDLVEMWEGKQKQFAEKGLLDWDTGSKASVEWKKANPKVPYPREFNEAVRSASSSLAAANEKLEEGYANLVKAYTKAKNVPRAKELRDEGAAVIAGTLEPNQTSETSVTRQAATSGGNAAASKELEGVWIAINVDRHGTMMTPQQLREQSRRIIIEGNTLTFEETIEGKVVKYGGSFTADTHKKTIDLTGKGPKGAPFDLLAIYEVRGDELKLCYRRNSDGKAERPTQFKAFSESPNFSMFYTCKRLPIEASASTSPMEGIWKVTAEHEFGRELSTEELRTRNRHVTIKGSVLTTSRVINEKLGTYTGTLKIDPAGKAFDFAGDGPNGKPVEWTGIYKVNGDSMTLCYRVKGEGETPRPTEFKSLSEKPGTIMFECKREE